MLFFRRFIDKIIKRKTVDNQTIIKTKPISKSTEKSKQQSFAVESEETKPQQVMEYQNENQKIKQYKTRATVFIIDKSGSMEGNKIKSAKEGLWKITKNRLQNNHAIGILTFNNYLIWVNKLSITSPKTVIQNIGSISPGGSTALWDAIREGLDGIVSYPAEEKGILVVTDGMDNSSNMFPRGRDGIEALANYINMRNEDRNICIRIIGIGNREKKYDEMKGINEEWLKELRNNINESEYNFYDEEKVQTGEIDLVKEIIKVFDVLHPLPDHKDPIEFIYKRLVNDVDIYIKNPLGEAFKKQLPSATNAKSTFSINSNVVKEKEELQKIINDGDYSHKIKDAVTFYCNGKEAKAITKFDEYLKTTKFANENEKDFIRYFIGLCYYRLRKYEDAFEYTSKITEDYIFNPKTVFSRLYWSVVLEKAKKDRDSTNIKNSMYNLIINAFYSYSNNIIEKNKHEENIIILVRENLNLIEKIVTQINKVDTTHIKVNNEEVAIEPSVADCIETISNNIHKLYENKNRIRKQLNEEDATNYELLIDGIVEGINERGERYD